MRQKKTKQNLQKKLRHANESKTSKTLTGRKKDIHARLEFLSRGYTDKEQKMTKSQNHKITRKPL